MKKINIFNRNTNLPSYRRMPVSGGFNRGGGIPLFSGMTAVIFALFVATPSFAEPTELDKKTVASKSYVDTKQDIITTGLVTFHEPEEQIDHSVPALVSYGTGTNNNDGVLGNKIGILGINVSGGGLGSGDFLDLWDDSEAAYLDNFVPTVRAVASVLASKQNELTPKALEARTQAVTRSTAAGSTDSAYITAGGSVGLTTRSGAPAIIGYVNGTAVADSTAMGTFTAGTFGTNSAANRNYIKNALVSLELLKDVYSELNTKITNNALPTGTTGTVVTYNGTNAQTGVQEFTETAVASAASYDSTTGALENGSAIPNITALETKQNKMTCAGYESGHENDSDYCWLWRIN